ncbi:MAG: FkbM family methyltransferase [Saprospiraceae bacterium]
MNSYRFASRFITATRWFFPKKWRLPLRYYALVRNPGAEPEMERLFDLCPRFRCAVDVGTNHGFYAYKMAQRFEHVFAFEANRVEDFDLLHYPKPNVHLFQYGLSSTNETHTLRVPVQRGVAIAGWASVENRDLPFADGFLEMPVELQRLDDQPFVQAHTIDLIKIDVEGHELAVLKGGRETIRRDKPVLIVENNEDQQQEIHEFLCNLGYRATTFARLFNTQVSSPNLIFLPE